MYFTWASLLSCNIKSGCLFYSVQINNKKNTSAFFFNARFSSQNLWSKAETQVIATKFCSSFATTNLLYFKYNILESI